MQTATERMCANPRCGKPLEQKPNETGWHFARRKTCGVKCAGGLNRGATARAVEARSCAVCNRVIERGDQSAFRYRKRILCGRERCKSVHASRLNRIQHQRKQSESSRNPQQRRAEMTPGQRDAYKHFCALLGTVADAGRRMHGTPEYVSAIDTALRIAAGKGNEGKRGGGSPIEQYGEGA